MKTLLCAAALAAGGVPAHAEDWRMASNSGNSAAFLIDMDSLKRGDAQTRHIRVLLVLAPGLAKFDAVETANVFDCSAARQKIGPGTGYDANGKVIMQDAAADMPWEPVVADSNYAAIADMVCERTRVPTQKFGEGLPIAKARAELAALW